MFQKGDLLVHNNSSLGTKYVFIKYSKSSFNEYNDCVLFRYKHPYNGDPPELYRCSMNYWHDNKRCVLVEKIRKLNKKHFVFKNV